MFIQQLRSGNYIDLRGQKVIFSHFGYIKSKAKIYYMLSPFDSEYKFDTYDDFKAVILDEEIYASLATQLATIPTIWLDDDYSVDLEFYALREQDTNGRFEIWIYYNNALLTEVKELHRLQNLFFELTDKELLF